MAKEEFRSSERVRTGFVKGNMFRYRPVQYSEIDGEAIFEGDIVLGTTEQMERFAEEIRSGTTEQMERLAEEIRSAERGVVVTGEQFRWPNGVVPFTIDPNLPNVTRVNDAVRHWNELTNIRLIERTDEENYVAFRPASGCSSPVGMRGRQQFINLAPGCSTGSTIHEIGHTVGLWHEQSRGDRDLYIRILWQNIEPGKDHNFNQHISDGDDVGPYDFGSIMHYSTHAFSRNQQPTIEPLGGQTIGQRNRLSEGDIQTINSIYIRKKK